MLTNFPFGGLQKEKKSHIYRKCTPLPFQRKVKRVRDLGHSVLKIMSSSNPSLRTLLPIPLPPNPMPLDEEAERLQEPNDGMEGSKETRPCKHRSAAVHKDSQRLAAHTGPAQVWVKCGLRVEMRNGQSRPHLESPLLCKWSMCVWVYMCFSCLVLGSFSSVCFVLV